MSARRLLLIDSDDDFYRSLYEQLSSYGFEIYRVAETKVYTPESRPTPRGL